MKQASNIKIEHEVVEVEGISYMRRHVYQDGKLMLVSKWKRLVEGKYHEAEVEVEGKNYVARGIKYPDGGIIVTSVTEVQKAGVRK